MKIEVILLHSHEKSELYESICTSDLHIKHGSVLRAVPGITVGHEMVGVVEEIGRRSGRCDQILSLIEQGKIDTTPLIIHRFPLSEIDEAYRLFENKEDEEREFTRRHK